MYTIPNSHDPDYNIPNKSSIPCNILNNFIYMYEQCRSLVCSRRVKTKTVLSPVECPTVAACHLSP